MSAIKHHSFKIKFSSYTIRREVQSQPVFVSLDLSLQIEIEI